MSIKSRQIASQRKLLQVALSTMNTVLPKEDAMAPAAKRRKITAGVRFGGTTLVAQQGIQGFGKISKSQLQVLGKSILGKENVLEKSGKCTTTTANGKKRKLDVATEESEARDHEQCLKVEKESSSIAGSRAIEHPGSRNRIEASFGLKNTITPKMKSSSRLNDIETPTKGARALLQSLDLSPFYSIFILQYRSKLHSAIFSIL